MFTDLKQIHPYYPVTVFLILENNLFIVLTTFIYLSLIDEEKKVGKNSLED